MLVGRESFSFLVFVLSLCPVQSDVAGTEIAVTLKVIRSRCVHINELQSLLMELQ